MNRTYEKVVDLTRDDAYPIFPGQIDAIRFRAHSNNILQRILNCKFYYPLSMYELNFIEGVSLYDSLVKNINNSQFFIDQFNYCLSWYNDNCIVEFGECILMLNGDSHPGNIIVNNENEFVVIDYLSDFLVLTKEKNRIYFGFLNFLKKYQDIIKPYVSELNLPCEVKRIFESSATIEEISDLSGELIIFSRDKLIENKLNKIENEWNSRFEKILSSINYDISKDMSLLNL